MATPVDLIPLLDLINEISPRAGRAPESAIERALRDAAKEFFQQSAIWRYEADSINLVENTHTYSVPVPADATPWRVITAEYQPPSEVGTTRTPIYPQSEDDLKERYSGQMDYRYHFGPFGGASSWRTATGQPRYFLHERQIERIRLVPIPTSTEQDGSLHLVTALTIPREGGKIPKWIADLYYMALAGGALGHLYGQRDESWTDETKHREHMAQFQADISAAAAHASGSHTNAQRQVTPRFPLDS